MEKGDDKILFIKEVNGMILRGILDPKTMTRQSKIQQEAKGPNPLVQDLKPSFFRDKYSYKNN